MSVEATSWVWNHSKSSGTARLVLLRIADYTGKNGANAWPSIETIAADCGVAKKDTVRKAIKNLVELGEMAVYRNAGGTQETRRDRRPNRFDLPLVPGYIAPAGLTAWDPTAPLNAGPRNQEQLNPGHAADDPPRKGTSDAERPPDRSADDPPLQGSTTPRERGPEPSLIHKDPPKSVSTLERIDENWPAARRLCLRLAALVAADIDRPQKPLTDAWVEEMERMIRIDAIPPERIDACLTWIFESTSKNGAFWRSCVQSPKKLRKQWDSMLSQGRRDAAPSRTEQNLRNVGAAIVDTEWIDPLEAARYATEPMKEVS